MIAWAIARAAAGSPMAKLRVGANGRYLVQEDGAPFFRLGDTAWHMFGMSVREDTTNQPSVRLYFATRARQGFSVIQSVMVHETIGGEGSNEPNAYGHRPFEAPGSWRPRVRPGPDDDYLSAGALTRPRPTACVSPPCPSGR